MALLCVVKFRCCIVKYRRCVVGWGNGTVRLSRGIVAFCTVMFWHSVVMSGTVMAQSREVQCWQGKVM